MTLAGSDDRAHTQYHAVTGEPLFHTKGGVQHTAEGEKKKKLAMLFRSVLGENTVSALARVLQN